MLTRACCCGGDTPIGCTFGNPIPSTVCVEVRLQGVAGYGTPVWDLDSSPCGLPGTPGILTAFSGFNSTFRWTYTSTSATFPGVGLASILYNSPPGCRVDPDVCLTVNLSGVRIFLLLICRADSSIGVRELVVTVPNAECDDGPSFTPPRPAFRIFRRVTATSFPLNTAIANNNPSSNPENLGGGGSAVVNVTAGPCSESMALLSADPDAVARQIAALEEPLARQRRASGCRGCGDAGGDALV